jgi:urease accessory protein
VRATAAIAAERPAGGGDGPPRLTTLRSDPPLTVRPTPGGVHLVGSSAGPLGGDVLALGVDVGAGAALTVRSAAATLAQPGPAGGTSRLAVTASVGAGGSLGWRPEPLVAVRGCDHRATVHLTLAPGAAVVWRDDIVLGRHAEDPGSVRARLRVDRGGRPLLRNDLVAGPRWPGSLGPAGVGPGTRAVTTVLVVGPLAAGLVDGPADLGDGVRAAVLRLAPDAVLFTAVARRPGALFAAVDRWTPDGEGRAAPAPSGPDAAADRVVSEA